MCHLSKVWPDVLQALTIQCKLVLAWKLFQPPRLRISVAMCVLPSVFTWLAHRRLYQYILPLPLSAVPPTLRI
jgi:hypothetical protein